VGKTERQPGAALVTSLNTSETHVLVHVAFVIPQKVSLTTLSIFLSWQIHDDFVFRFVSFPLGYYRLLYICWVAFKAYSSTMLPILISSWDACHQWINKCVLSIHTYIHEKLRQIFRTVLNLILLNIYLKSSHRIVEAYLWLLWYFACGLCSIFGSSGVLQNVKCRPSRPKLFDGRSFMRVSLWRF